jgi:hypothetical protein
MMRRDALKDYASLTRRCAARLLIGILAALCLTVPSLAGADERSEERDEAATVAKKVKRAHSTADQAQDEREALRRFQEEVGHYAELHTKLLAKLAVREESTASQKSLARAIRAERAKARPGDIFRPEIQPLLRRLIAEQLTGPEARDARKAVLEGNPGEEGALPPIPVVVRVNGVYPPGASRSTVPPSILATLPPLPEPLHYRFVGRDLILVDSLVGLIVDFLPDATPDLASQ